MQSFKEQNLPAKLTKSQNHKNKLLCAYYSYFLQISHLNGFSIPSFFMERNTINLTFSDIIEQLAKNGFGRKSKKYFFLLDLMLSSSSFNE